MRRALLYVVAAALLVLIVAAAWWSRDEALRRHYTTRVGDTGVEVASAHDVTLDELAEANPGMTIDGPLPAGDDITIPAGQPTVVDTWLVHGAGVVAELAGILIGFWLAIAAGIVPRHVRRQVLAISVVLSLTSYAAAQVSAGSSPTLTPQFLYVAIKDGFAWSAAAALFGRVLGLRDRPAPPTASRPPAESSTDAPSGA